MKNRLALLVFFALIVTGCEKRDEPVGLDLSGGDESGHLPATAETIAANRALAQSLGLDENSDDPDATRGFIAAPPALDIRTADGASIWNTRSYEFLETPSDSINPSLRRQAILNSRFGLFEVVPGIYQLRGFDLSNMTLIESENGWIVVDPLTARETAAAALRFAREHLGDKPVTGIIFTHSHLDHFGGVLAVASAEEISSGRVPLIAPAGFFEEATSENVIAGVAMGRRAGFMYGQNLPRTERGHVGSGLGKSPAFGRFGILEPTDLIEKTGDERVVDGVRFVFQDASGSEAPAEFTFYLPQWKAFCGAEVVSRTMHNLYTLRGAKVRDALVWSRTIDESIRLFPQTDVYFGSHHWPVWGRDQVRTFLVAQRDLYKFTHDQTVRLANEGLTPGEIAEVIKLPDTLSHYFPNRGYYGTLKHNARAVYQFYFGWYDAHPANLDPLPPVEAAKRYVTALGGIDAIVAKASEAYADGDYRWSAELAKHAVFAEPGSNAARSILAASFDQMGYQAESGPWRDVYLTGAYELRNGAPKIGTSLASAVDILRAMPLGNLFDSLSVRLNADKANGKTFRINFVFTDIEQSIVVNVENSVMHYHESEPSPDADATLNVTHDMYLRLASGQIGIARALLSNEMSVDGSEVALAGFFRLFDKPEGTFAIVTP